ncbi:MAG: phosphatidate cytidylyltransferase [Oscillospiraceae bacterium]|nr:phosphatidate cytidylyltransferase [Oscillospiraceae bacterium]
MKTRIIAAATFVPIIFIVLFFLPAYVLAGVVSLICAISAYELLHAIGGKQNERVRIYAIFSAVLIPIGAYFNLTEVVFPAVFLILMCLLFYEAIIGFKTIRKITFSQILTTLFAGALIPLMLSSLVNIKQMPEGHLLVLIPIISAFLTDAGAYFTGLAIGKKKALPLVSPKKTVEGCFGGLFIGTLSVLIFGVVIVFTTFNLVIFWALLLYGIVGAVLSQLGDLAFSLIKREFEIKDYGRLIPGHGGMLDRFDSMIFAAPAIYLLMSFFPAIIAR